MRSNAGLAAADTGAKKLPRYSFPSLRGLPSADR